MASLGQLAKNGAEKRVAPSRLRERARIGQEPWDPGLTTRRVVAVDDVAKRVEGDVLGDGHPDREPPGLGGQDAPCLVKREPEKRPV